MQDERTSHGYPLPHAGNTLDEDLPRFRGSFLAIDTDIGGVEAGVAGIEARQIRETDTFVTSGENGAFAIGPVPALTEYVAKQRVRVRFHADGTNDDTLNINGLGPVGLREYDPIGDKLPANIRAGQYADLAYDGEDFILLDALPKDTAAFITADGVTTAALEGNGDVGTGADQVARGDHLHDARYYLSTKKFIEYLESGDPLPGSDTGPIFHPDYPDILTWQTFGAWSGYATRYGSGPTYGTAPISGGRVTFKPASRTSR